MKINHGDHHLPLHWLCILHCIILIHGHEHNALGSKKVGVVFLPCEVGPFSSVLSVLVTHVIKFGLNPLIYPPGSLLTLNVQDVIFIWASDRDIINPLRRGARTISRSICRMWGNSWWCQAAVILILGAMCELVSREERERLLMSCFLCDKWRDITINVISIVTIITVSFRAAIIRLFVGWIFWSSVVASDVTTLPFCLLPYFFRFFYIFKKFKF
jgi:hypothetical protein